MALFHLHYLLTTFSLTVWTHAPALVLALTWALQGIMFIAGIDVTDLNDYIFWQFLTSLAGVLIGVGLLLVTRVPQLLKFEASYTSNWGQFILYMVLFVAGQLFYAFFPPPGQAWGIVGTVATTIVIHVLMWFAIMYNETVFSMYTRRGYFFLLWVVLAAVMELMFFVAYALMERWAAYISAGTAAAILITVALVFPARQPYKLPNVVSGEPLLTTNNKNVMRIVGDGDEDGTY